MSVRVTVTGDKEIADLLRRVPKELEGKVKADVGEYALKIQGRAKSYLRTQSTMDTGNLANSILVEFAAQGITAEIGAVAKYAPYVEFGAGPAIGHKRFFPPPDALDAWARHHGFDSAWPVCKAIYEHGLQPRPYLGPAYEDHVGGLVIQIERTLGKEWK